MKARTLIECMVDPAQPVQEINGVISLMLQGRSDAEQKMILEGVNSNVEKALQDLNNKA